jgi:heme exporter protein A
LSRWTPGICLGYRIKESLSCDVKYIFERATTTSPGMQDILQTHYFSVGYRWDSCPRNRCKGHRVLEVVGLGCMRGERRLFSGVSFRLNPGGLIWLQGGNGSGKTTLLRTLCGLTHAMAGEVRWQGEPIREAGEEFRRQLTYIGHANSLKEDLSAEENLRIAARLAGQPVTREELVGALHGMGLAGREHLPVKFLSQGQRRRAALARLRLAHPRPLWLLDEPFNALDTHAVAGMQHIMESHLAQGGMIALTTHQEVAIQATDAQTLRLDA